MSTPTLKRLKKSQTIPFIDTDPSGETNTWARIGKSTIFDLAFNPNTVTSNYIEDDMPTDYVDYYAPKLPQELAANKGDAAFDFIYDKAYNLPTGNDLTVPVLLVFGGNDGTAADPCKAWLVDATLILNNFNTVDEKITFDLNFGGNITKGTAVVADGAPVFYPQGELEPLTVISLAGSTTGKTAITVSPVKGSGNSYKYKTASTTLTAPAYGETQLTGYLTWNGSTDIEATTDDYIGIVELDGNGGAIKFGQVKVVSASA